MTLFETLRSFADKLSSPKASDADTLVRIKGFFADKALVCAGDDSTEFLRRLNRCETLQDLWGMRVEFYTMLARNFGELEAMRHTDSVQAMFDPFIERGKIKGATTRASGSRNFNSSHSRRGASTLNGIGGKKPVEHK
jgi:hypothetical protein